MIAYARHIKKWAERVPLARGKGRERIVIIKTEIQIKHDKAELAVLHNGTPGLQVVLRPVIVTQIQLDGHIVATFVYVQQILYLFVS